MPQDLSKVKGLVLPEYTAIESVLDVKGLGATFTENDVISYSKAFPDGAQPDWATWAPQKGPQYMAWSCDAFELLYGGARGGGKTSFLLGDFGKQVVAYGRFARGVIFRNKYKQLKEVVLQGKRMWCETGQAVFRSSLSDYSFHFHNGAILELRQMARIEDAEDYQGQAYTFIGFDECTNFPDFSIFDRLRVCARSATMGVKPWIRYTANPGGRLHNEVKAYFVTPAPLGNRYIYGSAGTTRMFIRSLVEDNKIMMDATPEYKRYLEAIPDLELRKAWLEGSWDVALGSFFGNDWHISKPIIPFIDGRHIPSYWPRYRSIDWGSAKPYCVLWWTVCDGEESVHGMIYPRGTIIIYREMYGLEKGKINVGTYESSREVALKIKEIESKYDLPGKVLAGPGDTAMWNKTDGTSCTADSFAAEGVPFHKSNKDRVIGWDQIKSRFYYNRHEGPGLYITENCIHTNRTLPVLPRDEKKYDDIDSDTEDHAADTLRYVCMQNQISSATKLERQVMQHRENEEPIDDVYGS